MEKKTITSLLSKSQFHSVNELIIYFQNKQPSKYFYKPIGIEVEITNKCNLKCFGCPIINDEKDKPSDLLTDRELIRTLKDCHKVGIFAYSITGGEPFLKFNTILRLISSDHGLDLYKLNTNGSFFRSINSTQEYLSALKTNGFGRKNKYIKSVLVISLGQQNVAGGPIQNAVNITSQLYKFFDPNYVSCSLNLTDANMALLKKIYNDFKKLYLKTTGKDINEKLFKIRFFSLTTVQTLKRLNLIYGPKIHLIERIKDFKAEYLSGGCFNIHISNIIEEDKAETLISRCVLRPNGDLYACPGFSRVHKIGNLLKSDLQMILKEANNNIILKTIFTKNLEGLYKLALKHDKNLEETQVEKQYGPCDVCQLLTKEILKH